MFSEPKKGIYKHYKGNDYKVIGVATHSETNEELVVYQPLYGGQGLWVRPKTMFLENVKVGDEWIPRFQYMGEKEEND